MHCLLILLTCALVNFGFGIADLGESSIVIAHAIV
jgi:hypothetical protein